MDFCHYKLNFNCKLDLLQTYEHLHQAHMELDKSRRRVKQAIGSGYWKESCQVHWMLDLLYI